MALTKLFVIPVLHVASVQWFDKSPLGPGSALIKLGAETL